jgi:hypothetical protein
MGSANTEVSFSTGSLRQPGSWGKLLQPPDSAVFYVNLTASETTKLTPDKTTTSFPGHPEGLLLLFGIYGYQAAGQLSSAFILLKTQAGAQCEWQVPGYLAKFSAKDAVLLAKAENNLAPIYAAVQQAGYKKVQELQDVLRKEGRDRSPAK